VAYGSWSVEAGAILHTGVHVTGPVLDDDRRAIGVAAQLGKEPAEFRAPLVIAADGVSGKLPLAMGLAKRADRPPSSTRPAPSARRTTARCSPTG
jgi:menaquinone-9 beta-reductase